MPKKNHSYRASRTVALASRQAPLSMNEVERSVVFVATTEAPVQVMDWSIWQMVNEVLRMDGVITPPSGQVPLLDAHSRFSVGDLLGSFREMSVETTPAGSQMVGRAVFSATEEGEKAFQKVREGHLTDVSVGYEVLEYTNLENDETVQLGAETYTGPLRLVTKWALSEVSLCPIGADPDAKARSKQPTKPAQELPMPKSKSRKQTAKTTLAQRAEPCAYLVDGECTLTGGPVCEYLTENGCSKDTEPGEEETPDSPETNDTVDTEGERTKSRATVPTHMDNSVLMVQAERSRITSIRSMCQSFGMDADFENTAVNQGHALDAVRAAIMDRLAARGNSGASFRVESGRTEPEKVRAAAIDGVLQRCGLTLEKPEAGSNDYRAMTMREMARDMLIRSGHTVPHDPMSLMGRALTTTDLPLVLVESANRYLLTGWENTPKTWETWCNVGNVNDFRINKAVGFDAAQELDLVPEHGEYSFAYGSETGEQYKLATYGKIFPISRQALINDDLGVFSRIPAAHGEAASNTVNRLAYRVLTSNAKMGDGKALFHADHKNLYTSGGGAPTVANLGAVETGMAMQVDSQGNLISVMPQFYLAPVSLKTASEEFFLTSVIGTQAKPNVVNQFAGARFTRVYDAALDQDSPAIWYMAGPKGKTVTVFFLGGSSTPRLETKEGWSVDGVEMKVSIDAAAKAIAWQGLAKSGNK